MNRPLVVIGFAIVGVALVLVPFLGKRKANRGLAGKSPQWAEYTLKRGAKTLTIQVSAQATCDFGDLDAIDMDLYLDPQTPLVLVWEPYTGEGSGISEEIDRRALQQNGTVDISFPLNRVFDGHPTLLSICRDHQASQRCSAKETLNPTDLVVKNATAIGEAKPKPPDRLYWTSPLALAGGVLRLPKLEPAPKDEKAWTTLVKKEEALGRDKGALSNLVKKLGLLKPTAPQWNNFKIEIPLTYRDKSLCAK